MASVGSVNLDYLRGVLHAPRQTVEILQLAGVDGFGARTLGQRAPLSRLTGTARYTSVGSAQTALAAAAALAGTFVTVTDEEGAQTPGVLVESVEARPDEHGRTIRPVLLDGDDRFELRWEFGVRVQLPPAAP